MKTVRVVGGGPAGLAAAIFAANAGARVVVHEKNEACGVKLLATGGGRCNIGNLRPMEEWPPLFAKRGRFIVPALDHLSTERTRAWLGIIGVPTMTPDGARLYPKSQSAAQVRAALVEEALRLEATIETRSRIDRILSKGENRLRLVRNGIEMPADAVILACGGKSLPGSGSSGDGFRLARDLGHTIAPPVPGLVGLRAKAWNNDLAGLVLPAAKATFRTKGSGTVTGEGELLLTHNGVSGPAVLDLSGALARALEDNPGASRRLGIAWDAAMTIDRWRKRIIGWRKARANMRVETLLAESVPKKLARWLSARARLEENAAVGSIASARVEALAQQLGHCPLEIYATEGWDRAMVTKGGVALREIDPKTLASRLVPGLHFAGEVVDIDGPCGGYNLQWTFSSGALAGESAAE
ncbi:MAG: aminoacetone oxidase family FAD-binding enzyme [Planctomycetota bacterium]|jgi:predicted Rossmann fold flavoprotein|nr:aminoacetone oxidase family FAD-binding enzyme [Planctomycetota bacterium]